MEGSGLDWEDDPSSHESLNPGQSRNPVERLDSVSPPSLDPLPDFSNIVASKLAKINYCCTCCYKTIDCLAKGEKYATRPEQGTVPCLALP